MTLQPENPPEQSLQKEQWMNWSAIAILVYLLILAVSMIGQGFQMATGEQAKDLFIFATNPFLGLMVGILATALIQSSSTVTSIIVALVAGGLPVSTAVPIVMGSNIGTTITNTLVSLGHVQEKEEFKRAFAAATLHDFFNLVAVFLFFPLELFWHPLEKTSRFLTQFLDDVRSLNIAHFNPIQAITAPILHLLSQITNYLPSPWEGLSLILIGIALIFLTINAIGKLLKVLMVGRAEEILHKTIGRGSLTGMSAGTFITVLVQSSSTTTSLIVPLAGTGIFQLTEVYPFVLGANIGTCITALLAATAITGIKAIPALQIALIHVLYNVLGVIIIYWTPGLSKIPLIGAETLAKVASERQLIAILYIIIIFFLFPGLLLFLSRVY